MKTFTMIAAFSIPLVALGGGTENKIVYGEDNRLETFEAGLFMQTLARSTAGMFKRSNAIELENHTILPPVTLGEAYGLCEGERFAEQPASMSCSGFLVAPDLLVTAGHCIRTKQDCEKVAWAFDFKIDSKTGKAPVMMENKSIYKCAEVVDAILDANERGDKMDYSLIKLDRPVGKREPLLVRTSGKVSLGARITVIGHPSGLPQKVSGGARVVENGPRNYFKTNLDTFGGNSGSAVFDNATGIVEGILVRGAKDYEREESGCVSVHETTEDVTDPRYGESVTRITDIPYLKYRFEILAAAKKGKLKSFVELSAKVGTATVYDNEMNTALHFAAGNNRVKVVRYLVSQGADVDAKNLKGETSLDLAKARGFRRVAKLLDSSGSLE